ncbi:MAG TPA: iron-containing redox enzyme family protein [Candidatus Acidoferrales bacterium]|nr:iron-containing redox enzyme family protein [Candidatus Acidoferrales bacterium]
MSVLDRLDSVVDRYCKENRYYNTVHTREVAKMFVKQHRLNTRIRNSQMKLAVATNCPDWDIRIKIIGACSEEIIADHEHGGGKPHWRIIEELGLSLGMTIEEIREAEPLQSTQIAWLAWETLTKNRHWLEGLMANTCAERANVPGYGNGYFREAGHSGMRRKQYAENFGLSDDQLAFFKVHSEADLVHSNLGWQTVAKYAEDLGMEDAVVEAARINLMVWRTYWEGILDAGAALERREREPAA